jgi:hypothetical protein
MKRAHTFWMRSLPLFCVIIVSGLVLILAGCGGGNKPTIVQITNKISSLPAGQTYQFTANVEHTQKMGVTVSLTGAGTLVENGTTVIYLAPPAPPSPNTVTVTVTAANGSGVSDSDTFSITAATGPVVSISPVEPSVSVSAGSPVTLKIAVTEDDASDVLTAAVSSSSNCANSDCGSFGTMSGTAGSGAYTVQFYPPSSVSAATMQIINVTSTMPNCTMGTAFVTINP